MKLHRSIFVFSIISLMCITHGAFCDISCVKQIGQAQESFVKPFVNIIKDKDSWSFDLMMSQSQLQSIIDNNKTEFYSLVNKNLEKYCNIANDTQKTNEIIDAQEFTIPFTVTNDTAQQNFELVVNSYSLLANVSPEKLDRPNAILVINNLSYKPGDVIKREDITKDYFFTKECSPHIPDLKELSDWGVNDAVHAAAPEIPKTTKFFLDLPLNGRTRAFPGLLITSTAGVVESVVVYKDYNTGHRETVAFAEKLRHTACVDTDQSKLAVYQVAIDSIPAPRTDISGWVSLPEFFFWLFDPKTITTDIKQVTVLSGPEIIE